MSSVPKAGRDRTKTAGGRFSICRSAGCAVLLILCLVVGVVALWSLVRAWLDIHGHRPAGYGSRSVAVSLETAVSAYFVEYGSMPGVPERSVTNEPDGIRLLTILLGSGKTWNDAQSVRSPRFLDVREGAGRREGLRFAPQGGLTGLFDFWGNPYTVILETGEDDQLEFGWGGRQISLHGRRVAVYSAGPDKKEGTEDDIKTW